MDKQIIDIDGARVVRVNDLELLRVNGRLLVSNIDAGGMGLLRRMDLARSASWLANNLNLRLPESYISWDDMELLQFPGVQLFTLAVATQTINAVVLPLVFYYLIKLTSDPEVMGKFVNNRYSGKAFGGHPPDD